MRKIEVPVFFTDAGAPPSLTYLATWTFVLGFSFLVFGLLRRSVQVAAPPITREEGVLRLSFWWVCQLYMGVASLTVFDLLHRVLVYLFFPSWLLWRRHMLPIPFATLGDWVNRFRLVYFCGLYDWGGRDMCADWQLPVATVSCMGDHCVVGGREIAVTRAAEVEEIHLVSGESAGLRRWVACAALLTMVCIVAAAFSFVVHFFPSIFERTKTDDDSEGENSSEAELDSGCEDELWWDLGEPDDACLLSPEALAEEARWRAMEAEKKCAMRRQKKLRREKRQEGVQLFLQECWPLLLAVLYAALYAFVGGMPLLMRWVYPACIILVSLCTASA